LNTIYDDLTPTKRAKKIKPIQQKFDSLSVMAIKPLNHAQHQMLHSYGEGYHIVADGVAGTGKSFLSTYLALKDLFDHKVERIVFLRSVVPTRDIGFLPGTLDERTQPYWGLYKDHVNTLCECGTAWDQLIKKGAVSFETTSFMRGKTWANSVVVMDEVQNNSIKETFTALTRIGNNSRVIICGDKRQTDLSASESSWDYLKQLINRTSDLFDTVTFTYHDIVRSNFVKQIIIADSEIPR